MASIIDLELAKSLIKEFQKQNVSPGGPDLKTPDGQHLKGFFIDRQSLDTILSDPACVGLSLHLAKHPDAIGSNENKFTIAIAGAQLNTGINPKTPYERVGHVWDLLNPCPPYCTDLGE